MALLGEFDKCKAVLKALISFAIFILGCAGVVYLLVTSSNAKAARGGDGFGMKWSLQDRSKLFFKLIFWSTLFACASGSN